MKDDRLILDHEYDEKKGGLDRQTLANTIWNLFDQRSIKTKDDL